MNTVFMDIATSFVGNFVMTFGDSGVVMMTLVTLDRVSRLF